MANQFTIYQDTDPSAPVIAGGQVAGQIIGILDACLVNGYGAKLAAGWSKAFSGTNVAAYRAPSGVRHYIRVDNSSPAAPTLTPVQGYESMTDVNTGTHPMSNGGKILTSTNNPAKWLVAADSVTFYLFISDGTNYYGMTFGEFFSFVSNDSYRTILRAGNYTSILASAANEGFDVVSNDINLNTNYAFVMRGYTGVGACVPVGITGDFDKARNSGTFSGGIVYPNPSDGGAYISPLWISDSTTAPANGLRGRMRGIWQWLHPIASITDRDTISGTGDLTGRSFIIVKPTPHSGAVVIETSATLETN